MGRHLAIGPRVVVGFVLVATILVAVPQTAVASPSWRIQRCLNSLNAARSDPALTQAQKNYLTSLCDGDIAAEAVAEPQSALAPLIFPDHYYMTSDPTKAADRFGHSLHCMDTSADRFGLVDMPANPTGIDLTKPGGTAPLNYPGEFLIAEIGGQVRLFNRVVFWQTRPDNEPVLIKNQILFPGNTNTTVARVYNAPQHVPMSIWTEIDPSILQAWPADMNTPLYPMIIPGRIMNLRTWYSDTDCHDKRGEIRIPNLVLNYAIAHGFANGSGSLSQPTRIRLQSSGDPYVGSNWSLLTTAVAVQNTQTTNGYKWFYAGDVHDQSGGDDVASPSVSVGHGAGTTFSGPNITLSGSATDNVGVVSVAVTIQDPTGDFLQSSGSFAPAYSELTAGLGSPGATTTTWSVDVTLPDDSYDLDVYARDAAGNQGSQLSADFVVGEGPDNTLPAPPQLDHSPFEGFAGPGVTLTGTATDNVGITSVRIKIKNRTTGFWLQADGSFATAQTWHQATVNNAGQPGVTWSIDVVLPSGSFNPVSEAFDAAGNSRTQTIWSPFNVTVVAGDTTPPSVSIAHPAGFSFDGPTVALAGDAGDNVGVAAVGVTIANSAGNFLQPDGTFAPTTAELAAILGTPGGTSTTWQMTVSLPDGAYELSVYARDAAGNEAVHSDAGFVVAPPDNAPPGLTVGHADGTSFTGPAVTLAGNASDNVGIDAVKVTIANSAGDFLQADGTFAATMADLPTTLGTPGGTTTTWSITVSLPDDSYDLRVYASDAAGNETVDTNADFSVTGVLDETRPAAPVLDHAPMAGFAGPAVTLTGTASDNVGVTSVRIKIKNRSTGLWLQADGSFAAAQTWHAATVDNPGATNVTWSIDTVLPDGSYNPVSEAFDAAGNSRTQTVWLPFDVTAGVSDGTRPAAPVLDHAPMAGFAGPAVTLTGTASDNVGVTSVRIKIKNRSTGLWLQADGSFAAAQTWHAATVDNPGATNVTWSIDTVLPDGSYNPVSEAFDAAGNSRTQTVWLPFDVL